jgi:hypothetical protein
MYCLKRKEKMKNVKIVILNMAIILGVILAIVAYVSWQKKSDRQKACRSFRTTTYVMEDLVSSDIASAQKLCKSRAKYINKNKMTLEEAIASVKMSLTSNVTGHIILLDTMEGLSTQASSEDENDFTVSYKDLNVIDETKLEDDAEVHLTVSYANPIDGTKVVSFYNKVTIVDETGKNVNAVLLRVVPVDVLLEQWKFSEYLQDAGLILMNVKGGFLVKSDGISGIGFYDYLNPGSENGQTVQSIMTAIRNKKKGTFQRTSRYGEKEYFVYRRLGIDDELVMIGCIPTSSLAMSGKVWIFPMIIFAVFLLLLAINLLYYFRDDERKKRLENHIKEQMGVISLLGSDYDALWVVEDKQGTCRLFQGHSSTLEEYRRADIQHSGDFFPFMQKYIRRFVAEQDRERVKEILFDKYFFDLIPQDGRMLTINYVGNRKGEEHYYQMSFAKCLYEDKPEFIIMGIRNVDEKVKMDKYQKELLSAAEKQAQIAGKVKDLLLSSMEGEG